MYVWILCSAWISDERGGNRTRRPEKLRERREKPTTTTAGKEKDKLTSCGNSGIGDGGGGDGATYKYTRKWHADYDDDYQLYLYYSLTTNYFLFH